MISRWTMFNRWENKLTVFDNFVVDSSLSQNLTNNAISFGTGTTDSSGIVVTASNALPRAEILVRRGNRETTVQFGPITVWQRFWRWFKNWMMDYSEDRARVMSVPQFFGSIKNSTKELEIVLERAKGYEIAIANAKAGGQKALMQQLQSHLHTSRAEAQLFAIGFKKFVTEETVVEFVKQCKKGIRLDWVANFARVIPDDVMAKKKRTDELGVFDNYVVLHYDPEAKSWAETEEEKMARRDPILFGVIRGNRRLYFVGDWVDEVCDLTLDHIADLLGKKVIETLK